MNTRNWYYLQPVTEAELDGAFADVDTAIKAHLLDKRGGRNAWRPEGDGKRFGGGVTRGLEVGETNPRTFSVRVMPGVAYDKLGRRMEVLTEQTVDLSVDENAASTQPAAGKFRGIGLFLQYAQVQSDPRTDGNGNTVYFQLSDSYTFKVRQTADYDFDYQLTDATRPSHSTDILLCEWLRQDTDVDVRDGDLYSDRREDLIEGNRVFTAEGSGSNGYQLLAEWAPQYSYPAWGYDTPALRLYALGSYSGFMLTVNARWDEFVDWNSDLNTGGGWRRDKVESAMALRFDGYNSRLDILGWGWLGETYEGVADFAWPYQATFDFSPNAKNAAGAQGKVEFEDGRVLHDIPVSTTEANVGYVRIEQMSDAVPHDIYVVVPLKACYQGGTIVEVGATSVNVTGSLTIVGGSVTAGCLVAKVTPTAASTFTTYACTLSLSR